MEKIHQFINANNRQATDCNSITTAAAVVYSGNL